MNKLRSFFLNLLTKRKLRLSPAAWRYVENRYSQFGEDVALECFLQNKKNGFFVDVGAYHPIQYSNTYRFYSKFGWRGINIDANEESIELFNKERPRDINLFAAVSDEEKEFTYYRFEGAAVNSISADHAKRWRASEFKELPSKVIKSQRLDSILDKHLQSGQKIDVMSVDCEDHDIHVLRSNNWKKYRPQYLLVEDHSSVAETELVQYCRELGYQLVNWVGPTKFFRDTTCTIPQ